MQMIFPMKLWIRIYISVLIIILGVWLGLFTKGQTFEQLILTFTDQFKVGSFSNDSTRALDFTKQLLSSSDSEANLIPDLPILEVFVSDRNFSKLKYSRLQALRTGSLITYDDSFVKAKIKYDNNQYNVKIRLKGDLIDHYGGEKWSLRVKVGKDNTIMGMTKFSLQDPMVRNHLGEWFFHRSAKREDLISLRYSFVNIYFNGEYKGIYALEEHFDKRLLEFNSRREAPIIKVNEELIYGYGWEMFDKARFKVYQKSKIYNTESLYSQYKVGNRNLQLYRSGELDPSSVFDFKYYSTYLALTDTLGGWHSLRYHNLIFYFNPYSYLFEPIVYDGSQVGSYKITKLAIEREGLNKKSVVGGFFRDSLEYSNMYINELRRISNDEYFQARQKEENIEIVKLNKILRYDYPKYKFPQHIFKYNHDKVKSLIEESEGINITITNDSKLLIQPSGYFPVKLKKVTINALEIIDLNSRMLSKIISGFNKEYEVVLEKHLFKENAKHNIISIEYEIAGTLKSSEYSY